MAKEKTELNPKSPVEKLVGQGTVYRRKTFCYDADEKFTDWESNAESLVERMAEAVHFGARVCLLTGKVFAPQRTPYKSFADQVEAETAKETERVQREVSLFGLKPMIHYTDVRLVVGPTAQDVRAMKERYIRDFHGKEVIG